MRLICTAIIVLLLSPALRSAEPIATAKPPDDIKLPRDSLRKLGVFAVLERFRGYSQYCAAAVPTLKSDFDALIAGLAIRIQRVGDSLLATDAFKGMENQPVPEALIRTLKEQFEATKRQYQALDASTNCPMALQNFRSLDDGAVTEGLTLTLTGLRDAAR